MPAARRNFIFELGADFLRVLFLSPGPEADVRAFDALMQVRPSSESPVIVLELSKTNGRIVLDYGQITLQVPASPSLDVSSLTRRGSVTEPAPDGLPFEAEGLIGEYDLLLTAPNGYRSRELYGLICFTPAITRRSV